jgi:hypothetical protein
MKWSLPLLCVAALSGLTLALPCLEHNASLQIALQPPQVNEYTECIKYNENGVECTCAQYLGGISVDLPHTHFKVKQAKHSSYAEYQLRIIELTICDPDVQEYSGDLDNFNIKHLFFW